jgi:hypothetical protein
MRIGAAHVFAAAVGAALGACTLTMPSDDELRGTHTPASGGAGGGSGGGVSGGSFGGSAGSAGSAGSGGTPQPCGVAADWTTLALPSPGAATLPRLAAIAASDVAIAWLEGGDAWARRVDNGTAGTPVNLSSSGSATHIRVAYNPVSNRLGVVWMGPALAFSAFSPNDGSKVTGFVYSADPADPEAKAPQYADIAAAPNANFGIVWNASIDCSPRLLSVVVAPDGSKVGALYSRLTDNDGCTWSEHMALASTGTSYFLAWADNRGKCVQQAGACWPVTPSNTPWEPDIHYMQADVSTDSASDGVSIAATAGVSDFPAAGWDGTQAGAAWLDDRDGQRAVWFANAGGGVVPASSALKVSSDAPTDGVPPSIAGSPKGFGVAYQSGKALHFALVGAIPDVTVASDGRDGDAPSVAWDGASFVIAYSTSASQIALATCTP